MQNVLFINNTSVDKISVIPSKLSVVHDTICSSSTVQHWNEQLNAYLTSKFIDHNKFKWMTVCVNYVFLRIQTNSMQDLNNSNECNNLCCKIQTYFLDDQPAAPQCNNLYIASIHMNIFVQIWNYDLSTLIPTCKFRWINILATLKKLVTKEPKI